MADLPLINFVAVIGGGDIGHGVAQAAAMAGYRVVLRDLTQELVDGALRRIRENLDEAVRRNVAPAEQAASALENIATTTDLVEAVEAAEFVIEAAPEKLDLKLEVFRQLDRVVPEGAVIATTTSCFSVTEIAAATERPGKVAGLHFFPPVPVVRLVEIVRAERTEARTLAIARELVERLGKESIVVRDAPGFVALRLLSVLSSEAARLAEEGVALPEDIDRALVVGFRHPIGPLRLADIAGLDQRLELAERLAAEIGGDRYRPPPSLRRMVRAGKLGQKSGEGFFRWE